MFRKVSTKSFGMAIIILVLGAAIYGFAAANTVPATQAGDGSGAITGYTISNIAYTLNSSDPSLIDMVSFDTDGTPGTVEIKLVSGGSDWYSCTIGGTLDWDCDTTSPQATVLSADELRVIAVE
jgi:hypothetical protein